MRFAPFLILVAAIGCGDGKPRADSTVGFPEHATYALVALDDLSLPTHFTDPRGEYTLTAGDLALNPKGDLRLILDLVPKADSATGHAMRVTLVESYARTGTDGIVFPASDVRGQASPEFFGRRRGDTLTFVARPLPDSAMKPGVVSVAREQGGAHTWRFILRKMP